MPQGQCSMPTRPRSAGRAVVDPTLQLRSWSVSAMSHEEVAKCRQAVMDVLERGGQRREADTDRVGRAEVDDDVLRDERLSEASCVGVADRNMGAAARR